MMSRSRPLLLEPLPGEDWLRPQGLSLGLELWRGGSLRWQGHLLVLRLWKVRSLQQQGPLLVLRLWREIWLMRQEPVLGMLEETLWLQSGLWQVLEWGRQRE